MKNYRQRNTIERGFCVVDLIIRRKEPPAEGSVSHRSVSRNRRVPLSPVSAFRFTAPRKKSRSYGRAERGSCGTRANRAALSRTPVSCLLARPRTSLLTASASNNLYYTLRGWFSLGNGRRSALRHCKALCRLKEGAKRTGADRPAELPRVSFFFRDVLKALRARKICN